MRTLALTLLTLLALVLPAGAADYYVSTQGKGKKATKEKPAKDLGNILKKLAPGDTVHIAGGTYFGRGKNGSNVITIPVSIIGGYDETFTTRDPWGAHKTIFSGDNLSKNYVSTPSLMIDLMKYGLNDEKTHPVLVDGIIIDHGGRTRYKTPKEQFVVMRANPKTGQMPTPSTGGLVVRVSKSEKFDRGPRWNITVQNCVVMNAATTQACLSVSGYKDSEIVIRNNLVINNSGYGIYAGTKFTGEGPPKFTIENNTVLFTWRHEINNETGSSFGSDKYVDATLKGNVFAFADRYGLNNIRQATLLLLNNNITGNLAVDYLEKTMHIAWADVEDEAELLHEDSEENVQEDIVVPVSKEWAELYASRIVVDRNKLEAGIKEKGSAVNDLRRMLGLPVQGTDAPGSGSPVWIHRMSVDDAIAAGSAQYGGRGCSKPAGN